MSELIFIEAVLPRDPDTLYAYCTDCRMTHYLSECRALILRTARLRKQVANLRQELADVSQEMA